MEDFSTYICSLRPKVLSQHIWWLNTDLKIPKKWRRLHAVGLVNFFCWQIITLLFFICHYRKSREKCYLRFATSSVRKTFVIFISAGVLFQNWLDTVGVHCWKNKSFLKIPPTTQRFFSNTDKNSKNVLIK